MGGASAVTAIANTLATRLKIERTMTFSVINKSGKEWQAINIYYNSGTSDDVIPHTVPSGMQHFIAEPSIVIILTNVP